MLKSGPIRHCLEAPQAAVGTLGSPRGQAAQPSPSALSPPVLSMTLLGAAEQTRGRENPLGPGTSNSISLKCHS